MHATYPHACALYLPPVRPSTLSIQGFNNSQGDQQIFSFGTSSDNMAPFMVGQVLKLECTANVGSYNSSTQIRFRRSNLLLGPTGGINMATYPQFGEPGQVTEDPTPAGQCQWELKSHVFYNMTVQDATRPSSNPLKFDCYVDINSINYETPDENRPTFYVRVCKCIFMPRPYW